MLTRSMQSKLCNLVYRGQMHFTDLPEVQGRPVFIATVANNTAYSLSIW